MELNLKHDTVKKLGLCRRCLKVPKPPHLPKDCKAPKCGKCGEDHNTMICPKPKGTQMYSSIKETPAMYGDDIFGDVNETYVHAIIAEQQNQIGYDQNEYEIHSIQEEGGHDQGNEAIVHALML